MPGTPCTLAPDQLFAFLALPDADAMNFLNEIALRFPDAVSFAAGRPYEGFFSPGLPGAHLATFVEHLTREHGGDAAAVSRTLLQYGRTKGIIHDLIAKHLWVDEGIEVDPEAVIVTVGAQEAIYLVLRALRRTERDVVLAVRPGYAGLAGAAHLADTRVLPVLGGPDGIDLPDLAAVLRRARGAGDRPRALYLNTAFANPTGCSMGPRTRESLLRLADEEDILLVEDNPYGIFGEPGHHTLKAADRDARVVYVGSFAKSGFPGARIGYAVADQRVSQGTRAGYFADQLAKVKSMLTVNTPPIAQAVIGGKLIENGFSMRAANKREIEVYRRNMRLMTDGLSARFPSGSGVTWNSPDGGFFLVVDVPFEATDDDLAECARDFGVLWTPIHHFHGDGIPRPRIRLSCSHLSPAEIEDGLDRLARFLLSR